jgi:hypothetical protein
MLVMMSSPPIASTGRGRGSGVAVDQRITPLWSVRNGKVTRVRAYRERRTPLKLPGFGTS